MAVVWRIRRIRDSSLGVSSLYFIYSLKARLASLSLSWNLVTNVRISSPPYTMLSFEFAGQLFESRILPHLDSSLNLEAELLFIILFLLFWKFVPSNGFRRVPPEKKPWLLWCLFDFSRVWYLLSVRYRKRFQSVNLSVFYLQCVCIKRRYKTCHA
jgi:hypothetical protein